jgi:protoporphyrinogen/coproporphyrinogen III oxidase
MEVVDVVVVGGGIAGLTAAYRLQQTDRTLRIKLFEASATIGGKLGSASVAGITIDTGADAFLARVSGAVELSHELGLADELHAPATGQAAVLTHGVLRNLPSGLVLGVPTDLDSLAASGILSEEGLADAASDLTVARPLDDRDRSVAVAIGSHLGHEVVERLVDPLLGGISAANCDDLSIDAAAPQLSAAAQQPHLIAALHDQQAVAARGQIGVTEQRPVFLAPRGGVHQLVSALHEALGDVVQRNATVTEVAPSTWARPFGFTGSPPDRASGAGWTVRVGSHVVHTQQVIIATTAPVAASLLHHVSVASPLLHGIRYASVALLVMAYHQTDVTLPAGSGMLVPRPEGRLVSAASWWDHKWPHLRDGEHVLVRASVGRIDDTRFTSLDDPSLIAAVHHDLATMHGARFDGPPVDAHVARWMHSFPQYDVGHLARLAQIEQALPPGIHLAGASLRGVGVPACIRSGNTAATAAIAMLGSSHNDSRQTR